MVRSVAEAWESSVKRLIQVLKAAWDTYNAVNGPRMAAALAYSAIFSLAPLLVIAVGVAGFFVGEELAQAQIYIQVSQATNREVAEFVVRLLEPTTRPANNVLATVVGVATLLWGATGLFVQVRDAINEMWGIRGPQGLDVVAFLRRYGLAMLLVFAAGALFLVMIVASTYVSRVHEVLGSERILEGWLVRITEFALTLGLATLLFLLIYRMMPERPIPLRNTAAGAVTTALLFSVGKLLLAQYLTHFAPGSAFGAAGALVVLLVWVQYSAQIFLFGAALTHVWGQQEPTPIAPVVTTGDESGEDLASARTKGRLAPLDRARSQRSARL
ncbi:MAG: hypothetical protein KatS3mg060_1341 [Dehalococcoidia bacterium]|nr:MAG: hypothetical protein KatS3mg060_1341 [Dehalococcoidia bacterium]